MPNTRHLLMGTVCLYCVWIISNVQILLSIFFKNLVHKVERVFLLGVLHLYTVFIRVTRPAS